MLGPLKSLSEVEQKIPLNPPLQKGEAMFSHFLQKEEAMFPHFLQNEDAMFHYFLQKGDAKFPPFCKGGLGGIWVLSVESIHSNSAPYPIMTKPQRLCGELLFI